MFYGESGMSAAGGVLRDHQGAVLRAFARFLRHQPIIYAELMAIYDGLEFAAQLGLSRLEVESNFAMWSLELLRIALFVGTILIWLLEFVGCTVLI